MHPYLTERMLHASEALEPLGFIAVQHRERLDGSRYPRGLSSSAISRAARILGAADAYQAMREPRPHRPQRSADEAVAELRADVRAGRQRACLRCSTAFFPATSPPGTSSSSREQGPMIWRRSSYREAS